MDWINEIDMIIPIPLHPKKLKKRGFNQSDYFAFGLSESLNIEVRTDVVSRVVASDSQTRKSRYHRWENVNEIFKVMADEAIKNKHILLVDDVITTGATLEACAQVLLKQEGVKVSVLTLAVAN